MELQQLNLFTALEEPIKAEKNEVVFSNDKIKVTIKAKKKAVKAAEKKEPEKIIQKRGRKSTKDIYTNIELIEVPEDEILNQKLYYSISEVARWFKVNTSQIRFWENEFDILQPRKNRKGDRLFRVEDIKNLQLIYYLLRNRKFSIEGAKEYLKININKAKINHQLAESLIKFRSFLLELKTNLES